MKPCVVDTSVWVEWLNASPLGQSLQPHFPDKPQCIVPTIVQLELSKWLMRELGEAHADAVIAYTQTCVVVPLDTSIALLAAELHRQYGLATADAIVYATARRTSARLLTCDAHFSELPDVVYFSKGPSEKPERKAGAADRDGIAVRKPQQ